MGQPTRAHYGAPGLSVACCLVLLAPWFSVGAVTRSAFAFVRATAGAGLGNLVEARLLEVAVLALPVLAGLTCGAAVIGSWGSPTAARWGRLVVPALAELAGLVLSALSLGALAFYGTSSAGPWLGALVGAGTVTVCAPALVKAAVPQAANRLRPKPGPAGDQWAAARTAPPC